jgi:hypothetical protein
MVPTAPTPDTLRSLVERLLDRDSCCPARIEAGRRRAADGPLDAAELADAVVAEGRPLLQFA